MSDYNNFLSLAHRYNICKHLLICRLCAMCWTGFSTAIYVPGRISPHCTALISTAWVRVSTGATRTQAGFLSVCWGRQSWMCCWKRWFRRAHDTKALLSKYMTHIWNVWHFKLIQLESYFKQKMVNLLFLRCLWDRMDLLLLPNHRYLSFLLNSQSILLGIGVCEPMVQN